MADINERVVIDTAQAQTNLKDLKDASGDADKALDNLKDSADTADKAEVKIPVEATGAKDAATDLADVDEKARAAGEGAKVGVSGIADMTGPLGDAGGAASDLGGAMEGAGNLVTAAAEKMGASPEQIGKLTSVLGGVATAVAVGAAAWAWYSEKSAAAKKENEELIKSIEGVLEATAKGDSAAAADEMIAKFGPLIDQIQKLTHLPIPDIVASLTCETGFGTGRIDAVNQALLDLGTDGTESVRNKARDLQTQWKDTNTEFLHTQDLKAQVTAAFDEMGVKLDESAADADTTATVWEGMASRIAAALATGPVGGGNPNSTLSFDPAAYLAAGGSVVNLYPPANTPIVVDQATRRQAQIQGPQ